MLLNVKPFINHIFREDKAGGRETIWLYPHGTPRGSRGIQMTKKNFERKKVLEGKAVVGIQDLRVGDAVRVHWLDASEDRAS